jgi:hypothetical protein
VLDEPKQTPLISIELKKIAVRCLHGLVITKNQQLFQAFEQKLRSLSSIKEKDPHKISACFIIDEELDAVNLRSSTIFIT